MQAFDLLLLAFKGIAVASLPLAVVWVGQARRTGGDRLRRLAWVTAFLTFDLVVFGGFTRLTDSGLGCPDWPGCYAKANPLMAAADIHGAERAMPDGPVTMNKAWIEMIHRYLAMAVGVLIVTMLILSVMRVRRARAARRAAGPPAERLAKPAVASAHASPAAFPRMGVVLLGMVMLQGAFGAWTVTQRLQPIFVAIHLLLGLGLLALLVWHASKLDRATGPTVDRPVGGPRALRVLAGASFALLVVQIALGGWVSANYAVLACTDFPTCQGVWLPSMDFADGFNPWRELGRTAGGGYLSFEALTAIHWVHRSFGSIVFVVLGSLAWLLRDAKAAGLAGPARALGALLVAQIASGVVSVLFAWPLLAAVLHNAGAAALVVTLVVINYRLSTRWQPECRRDAYPTSRALAARHGPAA